MFWFSSCKEVVGVCGCRHAPDTPIVDRPVASGLRGGKMGKTGGKEGGRQGGQPHSPRAGRRYPLSPGERELYNSE